MIRESNSKPCVYFNGHFMVSSVPNMGSLINTEMVIKPQKKKNKCATFHFVSKELILQFEDMMQLMLVQTIRKCYCGNSQFWSPRCVHIDGLHFYYDRYKRVVQTKKQLIQTENTQ